MRDIKTSNEIIEKCQKRFPRNSLFYVDGVEYKVEFVVWDSKNQEEEEEPEEIIIIPHGHHYLHDKKKWNDFNIKECLTKNEFRLQKIKRIIDE